MEHWHPNPAFFFQHGGGPLLDIGPYYVTALVNLIGPVRRVTAFGGRGFAERVVTAAGPHQGERIAVEVDTHVAGALEFASGAVVSLMMSWDVWSEQLFRLELFGTEGSLILPDPNFFGGVSRVSRGGAFEDLEPTGVPYAANNHVTSRGTGVADYRIIGVVDMALAIQEGRPHRCSGDLALHVLEVLTAFGRSAQEGRAMQIDSLCTRPEPLRTAFA